MRTNRKKETTQYRKFKFELLRDRRLLVEAKVFKKFPVTNVTAFPGIFEKEDNLATHTKTFQNFPKFIAGNFRSI